MCGLALCDLRPALRVFFLAGLLTLFALSVLILHLATLARGILALTHLVAFVLAHHVKAHRTTLELKLVYQTLLKITPVSRIQPFHPVAIKPHSDRSIPGLHCVENLEAFDPHQLRCPRLKHVLNQAIQSTRRQFQVQTRLHTRGGLQNTLHLETLRRGDK